MAIKSNFSNSFRFKLEAGSKKGYCINCGKKTFVRYIDIETGEYLPAEYGRCDRESKCGYHLNPYKDGFTKRIWENENSWRVTKVTNVSPQKKVFSNTKHKFPPKPVFFDFDTFKKTLRPERYSKNVFIQNLLQRVQYPFEVADIEKVVSLYRLGTVVNGYMTGANTFPFIDQSGNIRAIQVKLFNEANHTTRTTFLHSIIEKGYSRSGKEFPGWLNDYLKNEKKVTCLFGEHLLRKYPYNPIALVEAPKTSIYATLYFGFPDNPNALIWLAVYNKSSFSLDKQEVLKGRDIFVFPDLSKDGSTFQEWETKAKEYESKLPGTRFIFSDLLEQLAPEQDKEEGNDIADFLIKQDWRQFRKLKTKDSPKDSPAMPQWFVDGQGILKRFESGQISDNEYLDAMQINFEYSGLSSKEYVRFTNELEPIYRQRLRSRYKVPKEKITA